MPRLLLLTSTTFGPLSANEIFSFFRFDLLYLECPRLYIEISIVFESRISSQTLEGRNVSESRQIVSSVPIIALPWNFSLGESVVWKRDPTSARSRRSKGQSYTASTISLSRFEINSYPHTAWLPSHNNLVSNTSVCLQRLHVIPKLLQENWH